MSDFISLFSTVWHFEVLRIGDQPVRISQCVFALLIVLLGVWLARRASRLLARRLALLPGVKPGAAAAIEKLAFYGLVFVVAVIALQIVSIPISTFAVLGGALAIGLGFGAQNLFNNFISGLILIIEQPIRGGDLIEVEGQRGHVKDVGARCTRIRREDGVDLLVPNSKLLESTVVNWTLADRRIETSVAVGVAYGSPTRRVAEILEDVVRRQPRVLGNEPVTVYLDDFGDNALAFVVEFWTDLASQDALEDELRAIRSDVRFAIDDRFREAGIAIAFPQLDVHVDASNALAVRLHRNSERSER
ncbi:MAG: mechanosensitive ion channel family protein [Candidatus Binatia bacterium]